jgi:hypothetical protein
MLHGSRSSRSEDDDRLLFLFMLHDQLGNALPVASFGTMWISHGQRREHERQGTENGALHRGASTGDVDARRNDDHLWDQQKRKVPLAKQASAKKPHDGQVTTDD